MVAISMVINTIKRMELDFDCYHCRCYHLAVCFSGSSLCALTRWFYYKRMKIELFASTWSYNLLTKRQMRWFFIETIGKWSEGCLWTEKMHVRNDRMIKEANLLTLNRLGCDGKVTQMRTQIFPIILAYRYHVTRIWYIFPWNSLAILRIAVKTSTSSQKPKLIESRRNVEW